MTACLTTGKIGRAFFGLFKFHWRSRWSKFLSYFLDEGSVSVDLTTLRRRSSALPCTPMQSPASIEGAIDTLAILEMNKAGVYFDSRVSSFLSSFLDCSRILEENREKVSKAAGEKSFCRFPECWRKSVIDEMILKSVMNSMMVW